MNVEREIRISQDLTHPAGAMHLVNSLKAQGKNMEYESTLITLYPEGFRSVRNLAIDDPGYVERKVTQRELFSSDRAYKFVISNESRMNLQSIDGLEPTSKVYRVRHIFRDFYRVESRPRGRGDMPMRLDLHVTMRSIIGDRIAQATSIEIESNVDLVGSIQDQIVHDVLRLHNGWAVPGLVNVVSNVRHAIQDIGLDSPARLQRPYDITWPDITHKNLIERRHAITFKADGIRMLLALTPWGTFLITGNLDLIPLNGHPWSRRMTILDGELVAQTLWLFDALMVEGVNLMIQDLEARRTRMESLVRSLGPSELALQVMGSPFNLGQRLGIEIKPQIIPTDPTTFFQGIESMISFPQQRGIPTDGLILTGVEQTYNQQVYKWKPSNLMSVDFFILPGSILATLDIRGLLPHPELKAIVPEGLTGTVGEFQWQGNIGVEGMPISQGQWIYIKSRPDKATPNAERVYQAIQRLHQDPITLDVLEGRSLRLMRKYHNRVKRQVYAYLASKGVGTLVDVGSGKGGDLGSWKEHDLDVTAIEPNKINAQELIARAQSMDAHIEVNRGVTDIVGDDWHVELYQEPVEQWIQRYLPGHIPDHALTMFNVATFLGPKIMCILAQDAVREDGIIVIMVIDGKVLSSEFLDPEPTIRDPRLVQVRRVPCPSGDRFGNLGCIGIRLVDSATVAQEQIEGLVDVEAMLEILKGCGWVSDLDTFLDKELLLGPEEAAYSRSQRLLILKPHVIPTATIRPIFTPLPRGQTLDVDSPWGLVTRVGIVGQAIRTDSGRISFLHALLQAIDPQYRRLDPITKTMYVSSLVTQGRIPTVQSPIYLIPSMSWDMTSIDPNGRVITYPSLNPQISRPPGIVLLQLNRDSWEPLAKKNIDGSLLYIW